MGEQQFERTIQELDGGRVRRGMVATGAGPVARGEGWRLFASDSGFRSLLLEELSGAPFEAAFLEFPPLRRSSAELPFEWIVAVAPALVGVEADPSAFEERLDAEEGACVFPNLGGDAVLIAPGLAHPRGVCAHLLEFVRGVPRVAADAFLERVGREVEGRAADSGRCLWVSTSGLGVPWLHVRLDERPKYYTFAEYRNEGSLG